jgi:hypothetical protein
LTETVHTSWLGEGLHLRLMAKLAHIGGQVLKSAGKIRSCRMSFTNKGSGYPELCSNARYTDRAPIPIYD